MSIVLVWCSGETEDTFIADLSVGLATVRASSLLNLCCFSGNICSMLFLYLFQGQIKTGAPCRSERLAKYNQVGSLSLSLSTDNVILRDYFPYPSAAEDRGGAWSCGGVRGDEVQGPCGALLKRSETPFHQTEPR